MLGQASAALADFPLALKAFQEQLQVATSLGDGALVASAHEQLAFTLVEAEHFAKALPHADAAIREHVSRGALGDRFESLVTRAQALARLGRTREAANVVKQLLESAKSVGGPAFESIVLALAAEVALDEGRSRDARDLYLRALASPEDEASRMALMAELARAEVASGFRRQAARRIEAALGWQRKQQDPARFVAITVAGSEVLSELGNAEAALTLGLEAAAACERHGQRLSALRASLVVATNASRTGNQTLASTHHHRVRTLLTDLEKEFGAETWESILNRRGLKRVQVAALATLSG